MKNIEYAIILYWNKKDTCFVAELPEFPGCTARGKTYREALDKAETVLIQWMETAHALGRPIPLPQGKPVCLY
ncbi:MAG: type II toxin-antitoxin system HicB family antitoxin [Candidatus Pseudobacter hemicellulosilyticus]|uniref:Type II toxin-antitoxin system HicB family antitoxin n=1 Tax=Candidatus Pseudobacter hemicellulosilyticus TaxID=3121375 RepID=A0AAJ5WV48_9BACT|nr:MAG: type II toxin-antitoxin system HicB family antitoxin [Pseudobacter sp.]